MGTVPAVRVFAAGVEPVGVVAVGQIPTGVIAIGQGATGVIAIGQLARGVVAIGQLAAGLVAFGQLALGLGWAGGMLALAPVGGPYMLGAGLFGKLPLGALRRGRWSQFTRHELSPRALAVRVVVTCALAVLLWVAVAAPLIDAFTRVGGVFRDPPRVLR
jgi:hypothetical protein